MLDLFPVECDGFRAWLSGWGGIVSILFRVCSLLYVSGGLCTFFVYFFYAVWFALCRSVDNFIELAIEFVADVAAVAVDDDRLVV